MLKSCGIRSISYSSHYVWDELLRPKLQRERSMNSELPTTQSQEILPRLAMALAFVPPKKFSLAENRSRSCIRWENGGFWLGWKTSALVFVHLSWAWIRSVTNCPSSPRDHAVTGGSVVHPGWNRAPRSWDSRKQRVRKRGATGFMASAVFKGSSANGILHQFLRIAVHFA